MLLLVEDNPADVTLLKEALKESPVPVPLCVVADGEAALAFLHHEGCHQAAARPDLVLLDLNLPRLDSLAVLGQMKTESALKQIPVIILSNSLQPAAIAQSYALGANAYLHKPCELQDYVDMITELIGFWCQRTVLPPCAPGW
jgi:two-component system, chemotaxis family, response regulator Rcp1